MSRPTVLKISRVVVFLSKTLSVTAQTTQVRTSNTPCWCAAHRTESKGIGSDRLIVFGEGANVVLWVLWVRGPDRALLVALLTFTQRSNADTDGHTRLNCSRSPAGCRVAGRHCCLFKYLSRLLYRKVRVQGSSNDLFSATARGNELCWQLVKSNPRTDTDKPSKLCIKQTAGMW